jgi:cell division protein FtsI/penicillin-binding protein 2
MQGAQGAALLIDVRTRARLAVHNPDAAERLSALPGSTIKPFALSALLRLGRVTPRDALPCPGRLTIAGRSLNCSHPLLAEPMRVDTALAYSCNCFTAHFAARLQPGELAADLAHAGLSASPAATSDAIRLQALGEDSVHATLAQLAAAYRTLALHCDPAILAGLEGAVAYGTAQLAAVSGLKVAGKTGSVGGGARRFAWIVSFAPSPQPEVICAVLLHGQSGGADAAPIAARILSDWRSRRR